MFTQEIIKKMVNSIDILEGDIVLIHFWGDDTDRNLLHSFSYEIAARNAFPIEFQQSRITNVSLFNNFDLDNFNPKYFKLFESVDIVIDIFMYKPVVPAYDFPSNKLNLYKDYMKNLFSTFREKRLFVQINIPTDENALNSHINSDLFKKAMISAYDIDYNDLKLTCANKIKSLTHKKEVIISTASNCTLKLCLSDRTWFNDDGNGDFPCGEIYIAPIEEKSSGTIFFKELSLPHSDKNLTLTDVIIEISSGKFQTSSSSILNDFFESLPPKGNILCELGIGLNPNIKSLTGYTALDEKAYGTFHIGFGMNSDFGGKNDCLSHIDFVTSGDLKFN